MIFAPPTCGRWIAESLAQLEHGDAQRAALPDCQDYAAAISSTGRAVSWSAPYKCVEWPPVHSAIAAVRKGAPPLNFLSSACLAF